MHVPSSIHVLEASPCCTSLLHLHAVLLCNHIKMITPRKYWLITKEAVAPSRHDWKIVDWDVKPQHKQNKHIKMSRLMTKPTEWAVRPAKTQWYYCWGARYLFFENISCIMNIDGIILVLLLTVFSNARWVFDSICQLVSLGNFIDAGRGSSIGSEFAWHASGPEFDPHVRHILSWRLGHENIATAILPLPLIQEEQLSVTGERMCTKFW